MNRWRLAVAALGILQAVLVFWTAVPAAATAAEPGAPKTPIRHFIVLMQENHSFDNYFGTYPGADGIPAGTSMPIDPARGPNPSVKPFHIGNRPIVDLDHSDATGATSLNGGRMDGFVQAQIARGLPADLTMGYYDGRDIPFHWNVADRYVLFDRLFTSVQGGSYLNHVYWIAAGPGNATRSVPPGGLRVTTIFDRLEKAGVSWKFYVQNYDPSITYRVLSRLDNPNRASQAVWCPLLTIPRFVNDPELNSHIVDLDQYFIDLRDGTLPAVAYIAPSGGSEHPPGSLVAGQRFIRGLLNALMASNSWDSSAFMYTYDDWGGWYDHVRPPRRDAYGDGFRAPALLVSPYARRHFIDHTTLDFTSIVKFVGENWGIRPLTRLDATAGSIMGAFDFSQAPRRAAVIPLDRSGPPPPSKTVKNLVVLSTLYGLGVFFALVLVVLASSHRVRPGVGRRTLRRLSFAARKTTSFLALLGCLILLLAAAQAIGAGPARAAQTTLGVQTAPQIKGVRVILDGRTFLTDAKGFVAIATSSGPHQMKIRPPRSLPEGTTMRFSGWLDRYPKPGRVVTLPPGTTGQQVGFTISRPVSIRVVDPAGRDIPSSEIASITIGSSIGERFTFTPDKPPEAFAANRIVRNQAGLLAVPIRYSAREVVMSGTNVVYGGSQNFFAGPSATWKIAALLFPLKIEVRDALFGFPVGNAARLILPNGSSRMVDLGPGHAVTVANLPRGTYELVAKGLGFGLSSPTALSRPQTAKLLLLSWVDITAAVLFALLFVVGLPLVGGRIVRRSRGSRLPAWHRGGIDWPGAKASEPVPSTATSADGAPAVSVAAAAVTTGAEGHPAVAQPVAAPVRALLSAPAAAVARPSVPAELEVRLHPSLEHSKTAPDSSPSSNGKRQSGAMDQSTSRATSDMPVSGRGRTQRSRQMSFPRSRPVDPPTDGEEQA